ncbi:MAG: 8-demethylnovobiocic acid C(8)-methyltransferase [Verrucomicrobia subdivision 3 bacterium]|nr:8-demethylnovobiocic acid C(8)-methyltransferase [Limisphaerales bacterium]MCS1414845.1 8-demethylnovobiocic acid C(8)-methyltransferase [Limisphaerales bacterium]
MANPDISQAIGQAIAHYPYSDSALFFDAYTELTRPNLEGKVVIEVCCGTGALAGWLATTFPKTIIYGIDYWDVHIDAAKKKYQDLSNLHFRSGDALNLKDFADVSVDLVVGQATMHHLANHLPGAAREFSRVLKTGGRCAFIFEPLGHNPVIAAIRGVLNSRRQWIDESLLFLNALEAFGEPFTSYEVHYYNFLGYVAKLLPRNEALKWIPTTLRRMDQRLFKQWPGLRKHAANFNVFYVK